jgi:hypothetical protein
MKKQKAPRKKQKVPQKKQKAPQKKQKAQFGICTFADDCVQVQSGGE